MNGADVWRDESPAGSVGDRVGRAARQPSYENQVMPHKVKYTLNEGDKFTRLTVTGLVRLPSGETGCECRCDCGKSITTRKQALYTGRTRSCGCLAADLTRARFAKAPKNRVGYCDGKETPTHATWRGMWERCENPLASAYPRYGGRGIKVCERWRSYSAFVSDMGERPEGLTLDRIDNSGGYECGNCRWATVAEQVANKRSTKLHAGVRAEIDRRIATGESQASVAKVVGVSKSCVGAYVCGETWRTPAPGST